MKSIELFASTIYTHKILSNELDAAILLILLKYYPNGAPFFVLSVMTANRQLGGTISIAEAGVSAWFTIFNPFSVLFFSKMLKIC